MTGYARVRRQNALGEATVSLKSVNHRGLDLHFHTSGEMDPHEGALRNLIRQKVSRGHLDVRVSFHRAASQTGPSLNYPVLDAYMAAWRAAAARYQLSAEPDLASALRLPGVMASSEESEEELADVQRLLLETMEAALAELTRVREREGQETVLTLRQYAQSIREATERVKQIRGSAQAAFQARMQERLSELLQGAPLDPQRVVQEAAILADRSDIGEEITRMEIHVGQLDQLLQQSGEIGKKLDFLLQEMNREANTMLSKTSGIGEQGLTITELAIGMKSAIEKLREQSLNLE